MLLSMSACADLYLDDSNYGHCSGYLKNATTNAATRATPTTIYCTFLECIRQVNKDNLEARVALRNGKKLVGMKRTRSFIITRYVFARRGICIVRDPGKSTTARPTTGVIDPRGNNLSHQMPLITFPPKEILTKTSINDSTMTSSI
uniref:Myo16 protein n=1 Tax=Fopius arisanus TaxID=64838 RepID=A0A0C9RCW5_9HYME